MARKKRRKKLTRKASLSQPFPPTPYVRSTITGKTIVAKKVLHKPDRTLTLARQDAELE